MRKNKRFITHDIQAMIKSADECAEKAEKLHDLTYVAKSSSLRQSTKDKEAELKTVSDQLLASLLNCRTLILMVNE